ncbi:MAG TPA: helix-turn-helix domain-containing protein [Armatimonadota bacterium]
MAKPHHPLRALTDEERVVLLTVTRAPSAPMASVARATLLLAVAAGASFSAAARSVGRRDNDAVARLVQRFNREGLDALLPRHGGGKVIYGPPERERILREVHRTPDLARDGTKTWSLTLLQRALRAAPDGLPTVSTWTILQVLHAAGYTWQQTRTWCPTGTVVRKRHGKLVTVTDPEADTKKGR